MCPCYPVDGLAVYIVHIHGFFFHIHGSRVKPHKLDSFDWIKLVEMVNKMASKQASINKMICFVERKTDTQVLRTPCH